ncbi:unnamed protein product [Parnassius apollo]|uniref:(apollo) hypothetical protein n=1 Tax=Parnassius apollo TaxID=110799 RepID=A0A8S3X8P2_PARAO|nr:unnamed protein product [Parnassius apollo]
MVQKLSILSGLIVSATCMLLHREPLELYLPVQYRESTPGYNFAYEVNDAHTGDFKRQQEIRRGDIVSGQYSLLQPDGILRTVDYRADDHTGFNAVVNNEGRSSNAPTDRQEENGSDASERQANDRPSAEQARQSSNDQQSTSSPPTISHTSLIHHILHRW